MTNATIDKYLINQLLVATPSLQDPYFCNTVILICEQNSESTVGLIINRHLNLTIKNIFEQMKIDFVEKDIKEIPILQGGPIQPERGFVIHSPIGNWNSTMETNTDFFITTSRDILEAMAKGEGPENAIIALGYAGWEPKQLMQEIVENSWINCPATSEIIFDLPASKRWLAALKHIGINPINIVDESGHA